MNELLIREGLLTRKTSKLFQVFQSVFEKFISQVTIIFSQFKSFAVALILIR